MEAIEQFQACPNCGNTRTIFNDNSDLNIFRCSCGKVYCDKCSLGGLISLPRCPVSAYHNDMKKIGIVAAEKAGEKPNLKQDNPADSKVEQGADASQSELSPKNYNPTLGNIKDVVSLLQEGGNVNQKDKNGNAALHLAAREGCIDLVEMLIKSGADVNLLDPVGWTPLHHAAAGFNNRQSSEDDKLKVVEKLLAKSAKIIDDGKGVTPLTVATGWGHNRIAELLKKGVVSIPQKAVEKSNLEPNNPSVFKCEKCGKTTDHSRVNDQYAGELWLCGSCGYKTMRDESKSWAKATSAYQGTSYEEQYNQDMKDSKIKSMVDFLSLEFCSPIYAFQDFTTAEKRIAHIFARNWKKTNEEIANDLKNAGFSLEGNMSTPAKYIADIKRDCEKKYQEIMGSKAGGCYIATACYGSYTHPDVQTFRTFRDNVLMSSLIGRCFVSFYYTFSPLIARGIGNVRWLATGIRKFFLQPMARQLRKKQN